MLNATWGKEVLYTNNRNTIAFWFVIVLVFFGVVEKHHPIQMSRALPLLRFWRLIPVGRWSRIIRLGTSILYSWNRWHLQAHGFRQTHFISALKSGKWPCDFEILEVSLRKRFRKKIWSSIVMILNKKLDSLTFLLRNGWFHIGKYLKLLTYVGTYTKRHKCQ